MVCCKELGAAELGTGLRKDWKFHFQAFSSGITKPLSYVTSVKPSIGKVRMYVSGLVVIRPLLFHRLAKVPCLVASLPLLCSACKDGSQEPVGPDRGPFQLACGLSLRSVRPMSTKLKLLVFQGIQLPQPFPVYNCPAAFKTPAVTCIQKARDGCYSFQEHVCRCPYHTSHTRRQPCNPSDVLPSRVRVSGFSPFPVRSARFACAT